MLAIPAAGFVGGSSGVVLKGMFLLSLVPALQFLSGVKFGLVRGIIVSVAGTYLWAILTYHSFLSLQIITDPFFAGSVVNALLPAVLLQVFGLNRLLVDRVRARKKDTLVLYSILTSVSFLTVLPNLVSERGWISQAHALVSLLLLLFFVWYTVRLLTNREKRKSLALSCVLLLSSLMSTAIWLSPHFPKSTSYDILKMGVPWFLAETVFSIVGLGIITMRLAGRNESPKDIENVGAAAARNKRDFMPFGLLTLAAVLVILLQCNNLGFSPNHHGNLSSHGMSLAKNFDWNKTGLCLFYGKSIEGRDTTYDAYNRFPAFPFVLIGTVIRPFEPDLAKQIYVARELMDLFFILSLLIAYKMTAELTRDKLVGLAVVFAAFSSVPLLYYNDMIFNDVPALFGFWVVLYGIHKAQTHRLKPYEMIVLAILPISAGWQAYSVFGVWVLFELVEDLLAGGELPLKQRVVTFLKSPAFIVTSVAVLWGTLILAAQLISEWRIIGGAFTSIPSLKSAAFRLGVEPLGDYSRYKSLLEWNRYLLGQARQLGLLLLSFGGFRNEYINPFIPALLFFVMLGYSVVTYIRRRKAFEKVRLIMICSALPWIILMKDFVGIHNFQSIFYVGIVVAVFMSLISGMDRTVIRFLAINVFILFVVSLHLSNTMKRDESLAGTQATFQFQHIYDKLPRGSKVYVDPAVQQGTLGSHSVNFYLTGSYFTTRGEANYVVTDDPHFAGKRLTANPVINLYMVTHISRNNVGSSR